MAKSFRDMIEDGIRAEKDAINYYIVLLSVERNGSDRRSWMHALNEEKDHLKRLEKKLNKLDKRG